MSQVRFEATHWRARAAAGRCILFLSAGLLLTACSLPRWPIESRLTSPFGIRWNGGPGLHRGVDLEAPEGTPVRPMNHGTVRFAGQMRGYGNVVWIDHAGDLISVYAHLSRIDVRTGQPVRRDDPLGLSGQSGNASGPHLHFEVWKRGREIDPVGLLGGFPPLRRPDAVTPP